MTSKRDDALSRIARPPLSEEGQSQEPREHARRGEREEEGSGQGRSPGVLADGVESLWGVLVFPRVAAPSGLRGVDRSRHRAVEDAAVTPTTGLRLLPSAEPGALPLRHRGVPSEVEGGVERGFAGPRPCQASDQRRRTRRPGSVTVQQRRGELAQRPEVGRDARRFGLRRRDPSGFDPEVDQAHAGVAERVPAERLGGRTGEEDATGRGTDREPAGLGGGPKAVEGLDDDRQSEEVRDRSRFRHRGQVGPGGVGLLDQQDAPGTEIVDAEESGQGGMGGPGFTESRQETAGFPGLDVEVAQEGGAPVVGPSR